LGRVVCPKTRAGYHTLSSTDVENPTFPHFNIPGNVGPDLGSFSYLVYFSMNAFTLGFTPDIKDISFVFFNGLLVCLGEFDF
jgi:hypothetical protein